jgi:hypothetical protein
MRPSALDMVLGAVMERHSRPNIHAGWKFNFSLEVIFDDGSHLSGEADGLALSQDNRDASFGLSGGCCVMGWRPVQRLRSNRRTIGEE